MLCSLNGLPFLGWLGALTGLFSRPFFQILIQQNLFHKTSFTKPLSQNLFHKTSFTKPLSQNLFQKASFTKPVSQNLFHKASFTKPLSQNLFHKTSFTKPLSHNIFHKHLSQLKRSLFSAFMFSRRPMNYSDCKNWRMESWYSSSYVHIINKSIRFSKIIIRSVLHDLAVWFGLIRLFTS